MNDVQLPIDAVLPDIAESLAAHPRLVIQASPGAGKSTRVPMRLSDFSGDGGRVLLLEPRRIAARNLAAFLAEQRGEPLGESVGLSIRMHRRCSNRTRLEVITEGILTRRIQSDPELTGISTVIFDEFHERHLSTDLGLALALEVQNTLRGDLRLVLMSATLDGEALAGWLDAPLIEAPGQAHPVAIEYRPTSQRHASAAELADAARGLVGEGDVLVFAPGAHEIRQTVDRLVGEPFTVQPLHGELSLEQQRQALTPDRKGQRRVIVATNIAESSLTVPGVRSVVDSGLARVPVFDPITGLTRLKTRRIAQDSADQRAGRAGRLGAGRCIRLWSKAERLDAALTPEILAADLCPLALELALWGDAEGLRWLDPPPAAALSQARELLMTLGLIDANHLITAGGRRAAGRGTHPRLAAMLDAGDDQQPLAADLAALLDNRDPLPPEQRDDAVISRLEALARWRQDAGGPSAMARIDRLSRRWGGPGPRRRVAPETVGRLLARAFPDRIALVRSGDAMRYTLSGGGGARLQADSVLIGEPALIACGLRWAQPDRWIALAAPLSMDELERWSQTLGQDHALIDWDSRGLRVVSRVERRLGALTLSTRPHPDPDPEAVVRVLMQAVIRRGVDRLPWSASALNLRRRVVFCRGVHPGEGWPDWTDAGLLADIDEWLLPLMMGLDSMTQVDALDFQAALQSALPWKSRGSLDTLAPERMAIPSGRSALIDYSDPQAPVLAVKLQELFGLTASPKVAGVALTIHLLSPAGRVLQITRDLAHFWAEGYAQVRREMRGRYPKHPWPEDPSSAPATAATRKKGC